MTRTAPTTAPAQGTEEIQDAGHVDVLIVGAGVSGIGAAHHLRDQCPDRTFVILDAQDILFKQGDREPWTHMLEHEQEREILPGADLDDGTLVYH